MVNKFEILQKFKQTGHVEPVSTTPKTTETTKTTTSQPIFGYPPSPQTKTTEPTTPIKVTPEKTYTAPPLIQDVYNKQLLLQYALEQQSLKRGYIADVSSDPSLSAEQKQEEIRRLNLSSSFKPVIPPSSTEKKVVESGPVAYTSYTKNLERSYVEYEKLRYLRTGVIPGFVKEQTNAELNIPSFFGYPSSPAKVIKEVGEPAVSQYQKLATEEFFGLPSAKTRTSLEKTLQSSYHYMMTEPIYEGGLTYDELKKKYPDMYLKRTSEGVLVPTVDAEEYDSLIFDKIVRSVIKKSSPPVIKEVLDFGWSGFTSVTSMFKSGFDVLMWAGTRRITIGPSGVFVPPSATQYSLADASKVRFLGGFDYIFGDKETKKYIESLGPPSWLGYITGEVISGYAVGEALKPIGSGIKGTKTYQNLAKRWSLYRETSKYGVKVGGYTKFNVEKYLPSPLKKTYSYLFGKSYPGSYVVKPYPYSDVIKGTSVYKGSFVGQVATKNYASIVQSFKPSGGLISRAISKIKYGLDIVPKYPYLAGKSGGSYILAYTKGETGSMEYGKIGGVVYYQKPSIFNRYGMVKVSPESYGTVYRSSYDDFIKSFDKTMKLSDAWDYRSEITSKIYPYKKGFVLSQTKTSFKYVKEPFFAEDVTKTGWWKDILDRSSGSASFIWGDQKYIVSLGKPTIMDVSFHTGGFPQRISLSRGEMNILRMVEVLTPPSVGISKIMPTVMKDMFPKKVVPPSIGFSKPDISVFKSISTGSIGSWNLRGVNIGSFISRSYKMGDISPDRFIQGIKPTSIVSPRFGIDIGFKPVVVQTPKFDVGFKIDVSPKYDVEQIQDLVKIPVVPPPHEMYPEPEGITGFPVGIPPFGLRGGGRPYNMQSFMDVRYRFREFKIPNLLRMKI